MTPIYLDYLSANPLLPEVQEAMIEAIRKNLGNPSSQHQLGDQAAEALEKARGQVACLLNCANPKEIVFTSGGTESINQAIKGVALANQGKGNHIVTSNIEHNAVLRTLRRLRMMDFKVSSVSVDSSGRVDPAEVAKAITPQTILVTIMHSNNEIGTIQPIEEIARITREKKVPFHTDAVTSVGVVPVDVQKLDVDLLSFSANQFYGPAGVGGLYVKQATNLWPLLDGGVQENNKRAGTENLIGIIGLGAAAELAVQQMEARMKRPRNLKGRLIKGFRKISKKYSSTDIPNFPCPTWCPFPSNISKGKASCSCWTRKRSLSPPVRPARPAPSRLPTFFWPSGGTLPIPRGPWCSLSGRKPARRTSIAFWRF